MLGKVRKFHANLFIPIKNPFDNLNLQPELYIISQFSFLSHFYSLPLCAHNFRSQSHWNQVPALNCSKRMERHWSAPNRTRPPPSVPTTTPVSFPFRGAVFRVPSTSRCCSRKLAKSGLKCRHKPTRQQMHSSKCSEWSQKVGSSFFITFKFYIFSDLLFIYHFYIYLYFFYQNCINNRLPSRQKRAIDCRPQRRPAPINIGSTTEAGV